MKCNTISPKQQILLTNYAWCLKTLIDINGKQIIVMINSGTTRTFISSHLVEKFGLMTWKKQDDYELSVVDRSQLETRVDKETTPLLIVIQQHHETLTFNVVPMASHDIILDMSWLKTHNLNINWESWEIQFKQCDCIIMIHLAH